MPYLEPCFDSGGNSGKNHFYYVDPKSEGLVAYWKFDEGQGVSITDYANENNLTANKDLTWKPLELPEKNQ
ncbi:hypothetical protein KUBF_29710 [Bacteroides finegoldii]|nr:hypothetical protein KUBF_29710 [Bacteroides finegoldii]